MTFPGSLPRPARPETWVISWKFRSVVRKSGMFRPMSERTTPTRFTFGKWSPFAIIWVPMRMSALCCLKALYMSRKPCFVEVVSLSALRVRACGNSWWSSDCILCVPIPRNLMCMLWQFGQVEGGWVIFPQWWQMSDGFCRVFEWYVIGSSQFSHSIRSPQSRQTIDEAEPLLFRNKIACCFFSRVFVSSSLSLSENIE